MALRYNFKIKRVLISMSDKYNGKSEIVNYIHENLDQANYDSNTVRVMFAAIISKTPVLLLGPPGTGKTRIAEVIIQLFDGIKFSRLQGHEELGYTDLTGKIDIVKMNQGIHGTVWNREWIDSNVNFVDELNRMTKLSQNALLTQIAENRVIRAPGEETKKKDSWYLFTANYEDNSTFGIMEPLLDRIGISIQMGHPTMDQFVHSASEYSELGGKKIGDISVWQGLIEKIEMPKLIELEIKSKIRMTSICIYSENADKADIDQESLCESCPFRWHPCSFVNGEGSGWRASSYAIQMAKAFAILDDRKIVSKDDAIEALNVVLYHRLYGKFSDRMNTWFKQKKNDKNINYDNFEYMPHSYKMEKFMKVVDSIYRKDISYIVKAYANISNNKKLANDSTLNSIQNTANGLIDKENRLNTNPVAIELAGTIVSMIDKNIDTLNN